MDIEITKYENYRADLKDLPGMPPVGIGETPEIAVADLFFKILHPSDPTRWIQYIDFNDFNVKIVKREEV